MNAVVRAYQILQFAAAFLEWVSNVEQSKKAEQEHILDERIDESGI